MAMTMASNTNINCDIAGRAERPTTDHPLVRAVDGAAHYVGTEYKYVILPHTYSYTVKDPIPFAAIATTIAPNTNINLTIISEIKRPTNDYPLRVGTGTSTIYVYTEYKYVPLPNTYPYTAEGLTPLSATIMAMTSNGMRHTLQGDASLWMVRTLF